MMKRNRANFDEISEYALSKAFLQYLIVAASIVPP